MSRDFLYWRTPRPTLHSTPVHRSTLNNFREPVQSSGLVLGLVVHCRVLGPDLGLGNCAKIHNNYGHNPNYKYLLYFLYVVTIEYSIYSTYILCRFHRNGETKKNFPFYGIWPHTTLSGHRRFLQINGKLPLLTPSWFFYAFP